MNNPNPFVSIVIPVYNSEKTLNSCLKSILKQNYSNYEVIVVDNNSNDDSKKIIKSFEIKNKKLKYFFEPIKGRGSARNKGILSSSGEIILMVDSDCVVPSNWINNLLQPIIFEGESIVMGNEEIAFKNKLSHQIQRANHDLLLDHLDGPYINYLDTKNFAIISSLVKKLMFNSSLVQMEDFEFYLRLKLNNYKIRFLKDVKVKHYHKTNFLDWIRVTFSRSYWNTQIFLLYKGRVNSSDFSNFGCFSVKSYLLFPLDIFFYFVRKPLFQSIFVLISDVSWRLGLIFGLIFRRKLVIIS
ncbi:MAG: glycosyltransferase [Candidatus Pacearchaeota archaeon]